MDSAPGWTPGLDADGAGPRRLTPPAWARSSSPRLDSVAKAGCRPIADDGEAAGRRPVRFHPAPSGTARLLFLPRWRARKRGAALDAGANRGADHPRVSNAVGNPPQFGLAALRDGGSARHCSHAHTGPHARHTKSSFVDSPTPQIAPAVRAARVTGAIFFSQAIRTNPPLRAGIPPHFPRAQRLLSVCARKPSASRRKPKTDFTGQFPSRILRSRYAGCDPP